MRLIKNKIVKAVLFLLSILLFFGFTINSLDEGKDKNNDGNRLSKTYESNPASIGDSYYMFINKIAMPMNSRGIIADVVTGGNLAQGRIDGKGFLYSGGFMMSGVNRLTGEMWANAMASASRTEDYQAGNASWDATNDVQVNDDTYSGLYLVRASDPPFGEVWQNWGVAVEAGAYFYDGNSDGIYNPVDLNGNGEWDPEEDSPDILGDETIWCVYNDAIDAADRNWPNVSPQGIEIRQTVWAYATAGDLGNIMFVRYSLLNTGLVTDVHDSVYFSVWGDPDLGNATDDLVGSDPALNAGFLYNDGPDDDFGVDPPSFLVDFFQGPWTETGDPTDFALNTKGPLLGIDTIWGNKNTGLSSFVHYMQGNPNLDDPDDEIIARNYMLGKDMVGGSINPCDWEFGTVYSADCGTIDPRFIYSGDPVSLTGWINNLPYDQRQMSNTGPITLVKDKPVDIVVAYVVGRSNSAIASVKEVKKIDRAAQFVFQNNFNVPAPPPVVKPIVKANDNSIELIWETAPQMEYSAVGVGFDMRFEYYEVKMYQSNVTADNNDGRENSKVLARYDVNNEITSLIFEDPVSNERSIIYPGGTQLDSSIYFSRDKGRISLVITQDPFTNGPLLKNKPYFFSITSTAVNVDEIELFDALGTWIIPNTSTIGTISNIPIILDDDKGNTGILTGDVQNTPYYEGILTEHVNGVAEANVSYSIQDKEKTTNHTYEIGFYQDSTKIPYELFYYVQDTETGVKLIDSTKKFYFDGTDLNGDAFDPDAYYRDQINNLVDGVTVTIPWIAPGVGSTEFDGTEWYLPVDDSITGGLYVGRDIANVVTWLPITSKAANAITVGDLERVELRFGSSSKAFRYVQEPNRFIWNGSSNSDLDSGFVDVPFQAWVKNETEEYQLAVGYTESTNSQDTLGNEMGMPDAKYYPGSDIELSKEYIVIFNAPYSDDINDNLIYSDSLNIGSGDIGNGMRRPQSTFNDSLTTIGKSPWFNAMYVCGFETELPRDAFAPTGTFIINPGVYLTDKDKYQYVAQTSILEEDGQAQWDKVNVFPNPLFGINEGVSYVPGGRYDDPFVTFNNLPNDVTIKLYTLSGVHVKTLDKSDATSILRWDLENESGLRVASGMYIALINNPKYGDKVLKLAIIMPQKQIQNY